MVVRYRADKLSRRDFTRRVLRLTILKAFRLLMRFPSERIGRCGGGNSSGVRALGFKDDRLKRRSRASCRGRYRWRWLDLVYVRLHRLENSYVANCNSMLAIWLWCIDQSTRICITINERTRYKQSPTSERTIRYVVALTRVVTFRLIVSRCYVLSYRIASYRVVWYRVVSRRVEFALNEIKMLSNLHNLTHQVFVEDCIKYTNIWTNKPTFRISFSLKRNSRRIVALVEFSDR